MNGELGVDRGTVRAAGVEVRTSIKRASGQPSQINSDKEPEGFLETTDSEGDLKMERESKRNRHSRTQAG